MRTRLATLLALVVCATPAVAQGSRSVSAPAPQPRLVSQRIELRDGRTIALRVHPDLDIAIAAEGLRRVRGMAMSPDGRLFVTDMFDKSDNRRGTIHVLDGFDDGTRRFASVKPYLRRLRNPNSIAFVTDSARRHWLYVALTDHLVRFRYMPGDSAPSSPAERIAAFPDSGRDPSRGGWHLTRTIAVGDGKLYVSVGSSCNACIEREEMRAVVIEMNLDGSARRIVARGLRNAVGLARAGDTTYATTMGVDHLGGDAPDDLLVAVTDGADFGWPACFESRGLIRVDSLYAAQAGGARRCAGVPRSVAAFPAHSAPIGVEWFDQSAPPALARSFVVALHGSGWPSMARGFAVVRVRAGTDADTLVAGFLRSGRVRGRPAFILRHGDGFFVTDDAAGVVYHVSAAPRPAP